MKYSSILALCVALLCLAYTYAECDGKKESDDSDVTAWFKNIGCKIQKGAEDLSEQAKPWVEKAGSTAKDFGNTVAKTYDDIKHKITDDNKKDRLTGDAVMGSSLEHTPVEKVPLAPLNGEAGAAPAAAAP